MKLHWRMWIVAFLIVLCSILGMLLWRETRERERQATAAAVLRQRVEALEANLAADRLVRARLDARLAALSPWPIHAIDLVHLRRQGLASPVQDLTADLQRHPELIPYPGTLGGRMGFYDSDGIRVLNGEWVYAPFEDGHVGGQAVFGYRVAPGGRISWRVIVSRRM